MASWKNAWIELEESIKESAEKLEGKKAMSKEKQIVNEMIKLMEFIAAKNDLPKNNTEVIKENKDINIINASSNSSKKKVTKNNKKGNYTRKKKSNASKIVDKVLNYFGLD